MHLGEDSGSDFEEEYKQKYIAAKGDLPGSRKNKRNKKMTMDDMITEATSCSDNEISEDGSEDERFREKKVYKGKGIRTSIIKSPKYKFQSTLNKQIENIKYNRTPLSRALGDSSKINVLQSLELTNENLNLSESSSEDGCQFNSLSAKIASA